MLPSASFSTRMRSRPAFPIVCTLENPVNLGVPRFRALSKLKHSAARMHHGLARPIIRLRLLPQNRKYSFNSNSKATLFSGSNALPRRQPFTAFPQFRCLIILVDLRDELVPIFGHDTKHRTHNSMGRAIHRSWNCTRKDRIHVRCPC